MFAVYKGASRNTKGNGANENPTRSEDGFHWMLVVYRAEQLRTGRVRGCWPSRQGEPGTAEMAPVEADGWEPSAPSAPQTVAGYPTQVQSL